MAKTKKNDEDSQDESQNGATDGPQEPVVSPTEPSQPNEYDDIIGAGEKIVSVAEKAKDIVMPKSEDVYTSLKSVTADVGIVKDAITALENVSFDKLISGPLDACVKAQSDAAKSTLEFIRTVGLKEKNGTQYVATVAFTFLKNGKVSTLHIPLISLVPIPSLAIEQMTYTFKVKIDSTSVVSVTSSSSNQSSFSVSIPYPGQEGENQSKGGNGGQKEDKGENGGKQQPKNEGKSEGNGEGKGSGAQSTGSSDDKKSSAKSVTEDMRQKVLFGVSYSSKKDSEATKYSKYSVETNMDINITVGKEDMPGGISKMLEILNDSVDISDPNGSLTVSAERVTLESGVAIVKASYKNEDGIFDCSKISCEGGASVKIINNVETAQLVFTKPGLYTVKAGNRNQAVFVENKQENSEEESDG